MLKVTILDQEISAIGYGTWELKQEQAGNLVYEAIKLGYSNIDTAQVYGNEAEVGKGINQAIGEGLIKREDLFLTSKVWPNKFDKNKFTANDVCNSIQTSKSKLEQDYIDMMLIHWPTVHKMETLLDGFIEAKKKGYIRYIGVSNFDEIQTEKAMKYLESKGEKLAANQVEYSMYYEPKKIINYCMSNNILITAYSSLGSRQRAGNASETDTEILTSIANKYKVPYQTIILRYLTQKGNIMIIPASTNLEHMQSNLHIDQILLDKEDIKKLDNVDKNNSIIYEKYKDILYNS